MMRVLIIVLAMAGAAQAGEVPHRALFSPSGGFVAQAPGTQPLTGAASSQQTLASFMYFAPDKWSFWWQGRRVAANAVPDDMTDIEVTPNRVRFTQGGKTHEFLTGKF